MYGHLIDLDNQPGMQPVGIRKTWRHLFAKCVMKVTGPESTTVCQDDQLCDVLKAGTDGAVHGVQDIWDDNFSTYDWVFLIVGAKNDFNNIKKLECFGQFAMYGRPELIFFKLLFSMVIDGTAKLEWYIQLPTEQGRRDAWRTNLYCAYGIDIIPLIKQLQSEFSVVTQPWYAENDGALGTFKKVDLYFNSLKRFIPVMGITPNLQKAF